MGNAATSLGVSFDKAEPVEAPSRLYKRHHGVKDGKPVSIFEYTGPVFEKHRGAVTNALLRMKGIRHPYVVEFVAGTEVAKAVYIVTEEVTPLNEWLGTVPKQEGNDETKMQHWYRWGLYTVSSALSFLHTTCDLSHCNLSVENVFVTKVRPGASTLCACVGVDLYSLLLVDITCCWALLHVVAAAEWRLEDWRI